MTHDSSDPTERLVDAAVDACAVVVGLGVMALNRFQAVRRQVVATSANRDHAVDDRPDAGSSDRPDDVGTTT